MDSGDLKRMPHAEFEGADDVMMHPWVIATIVLNVQYYLSSTYVRQLHHALARQSRSPVREGPNQSLRGRVPWPLYVTGSSTPSFLQILISPSFLSSCPLRARLPTSLSRTKFILKTSRSLYWGSSHPKTFATPPHVRRPIFRFALASGILLVCFNYLDPVFQNAQHICCLAECPLTALNAVSAMGTRLCFYRKPKNGPTQPPVIEPHPTLETETAPAERWDRDVLEEDGIQRFQTIVDEIKQGCAALA